MSELEKYSIVATTFNDEKEIIRFLDNVCSQNSLPDEIVIADGGSKDHTVELIQNYSLKQNVPIRIIKGGRLNIAQGYNTAIKATSNELIGITGIGNVYTCDFFSVLLENIGNNDVVYPPVRGYDSGDFSKRYNSTVLHGKDGSVMDIASNHGALVRKNVFEELGYFYEKFVYAGEDAEFYALVRENGYKTKCVKDAYVYWITPNTFQEYKKQKRVYAIGDLQIHRNIDIFKRLLKFYTPLLTIVICSIFDIRIGLVLLLISTIYICLKYNIGRNGNKVDFWIWLIEKYNKPIQYLRNIKYIANKYKVRR